ncbi:MAG TPA: HNH endonuclease signature motif containing protein [Blastocatellia bacterium]
MRLASYLCEYCLIDEGSTFLGCSVDHIVSVKHGGPTEVDNLAYACLFCNRHKGTDLGSLLQETGDLIKFFNPRTDKWPDHFRLEGAIIQPLTSVGEVTARILKFNDPERILERETLAAAGRFPTKQALTLITPLS